MIADVHYRLLVKWKFSFSLFVTRFNRSPKTVTSFAGLRFLYTAEKQGWWWAVNLQEDVYQLQKLWKPFLNEPQKMKIEVSFQRRRMSTGRVLVLFNQRRHFVLPREYQPRSQGLSPSHKREWSKKDRDQPKPGSFFDHSLLWEDERPWERGCVSTRRNAGVRSRWSSWTLSTA